MPGFTGTTSAPPLYTQTLPINSHDNMTQMHNPSNVGHNTFMLSLSAQLSLYIFTFCHKIYQTLFNGICNSLLYCSIYIAQPFHRAIYW